MKIILANNREYDLTKKHHVSMALGYIVNKLRNLEVEINLAYQSLDGDKIEKLQQEIELGKKWEKKLKSI